MIELNTEHPKFDMAMELLALLTTKLARKSTLVADLGLNTVKDLSPIVADLRNRGHRIEGHSIRRGGGAGLCVSKDGMDKAFDEVSSYLDIVE